jgi:cysteinyl-tRNA synthetase
MGLRLYNTLTRKVEDIVPIKANEISMYNCGPTVYWRMQIGNLRAYANWDILHRSLLYLGFKVKRVVNFTDVGHMTEDEDFGVDKIEKTALKEGKEPLDIANYYIQTVLNDFKLMNYLNPDGSVVDLSESVNKVGTHGWARATDHIQEMIDITKLIEKNGYTYETDLALYFDTSKYSDYTGLSWQKQDEKKVGVRDEVVVDPQKKNPADFVLWMKRVGKYQNHIMHWDSPWGDGFPGWHIECTAMGCKYLGDHFDIHTGGVDHIAVHHTNERAQNYAAFGHEVVNYWIHNEFITTESGDKLSKSKGNAWTLDEVIAAGFIPLDLRYLYISANYRVALKFSSKTLESAKNARLALEGRERKIAVKSVVEKAEGKILDAFVSEFKLALEDNLNMSQAFAVVSKLLASDESASDILKTVLDFDRVLGLDLQKVVDEANSDKSDSKLNIDPQVEEILEERKKARADKDFVKSDELRDKLKEKGFVVKDTSEGQILEKI